MAWHNITPTALLSPRQKERVLAQYKLLRTETKNNVAFGDFLEQKNARPFIEGILSASPFLTQLMFRHHHFLGECVGKNIKDIIDALCQECDHAHEITHEEEFMSFIRRLRQKQALIIAFADLAGWSDLETTTHYLSQCAISLVRCCLDFIMDVPQEESGFMVLALGKLGAHELNYSSDIDIILLYDQQHPLWRNQDHAPLHKIGKKLTHLLSTPTTDGIAHRTDFRLTPDIGTASSVISLQNAETYYESRGRSWERAAFIKASAIAGDIKTAHQFLNYLTPFVWRRNLDYTAIQDILAISHRYKTKTHSWQGFHLKKDAGGIRDIEFYLQSLQLLWGGRNPQLRTKASLPTIKNLEQHKHITKAHAKKLRTHYTRLRILEHRLQMMNDAQTHSLPKNDEAFDIVAHFAGHKNKQNFIKELEHITQDILAIIEPRQAEDSHSLPSNDQEWRAWLAMHKFQNADSCARLIEHWHHCNYPALSDGRSRALFDSLLPNLLTHFGTDSYQGLIRFDQFIKSLPAGVQLFTLLKTHPHLLSLISLIMSAAPRLANRLARRPHLLDNVLEHHFYDAPKDRHTLSMELKHSLADCASLEEILNRARIWAKDKKFQLGVHLLMNRLTILDAAPLYTHIAQELIEAIMNHCLDNFSSNYGTMNGDGLAIIALGKLGGEILSGASDLDLVFVYDETKTPNAQLMPSVYYIRLVQRFITALSAPTEEGDLYQIDTRLRPEGDKAPLAISLQSFTTYYQERARLWEKMALAKARLIYGAPALQKKLQHFITDILTQPHDEQQTARQAHRMRKAMKKEHLPKNKQQAYWSFKYREGGSADIDFIHQTLLLTHAHLNPSIVKNVMDDSLKEMAQLKILQKDEARYLMDASHLWRQLDGIVRLCYRTDFTLEDASPSLRQLLTHQAGAKNEQELIKLIDEHSALVMNLYEHFINV